MISGSEVGRNGCQGSIKAKLAPLGEVATFVTAVALVAV